MSNFAFGTYRISDYNPQHIEALKEAIDSGITMIDTSSNYMDGGAERAIALAFREYEDKKNDIAPKYVDRAGGYTRITRTRIRRGDATTMAFIELV